MTATAGTIVPARITWALDARGLGGPDVDIACGTWEGNPDGDVDAWEAGTAVPTPQQVEQLAQLTRMPVAWFSKAVPDWLAAPRRVFLCDRGRREYGLAIMRSWVDAAGVAHTVQETPEPPPYRPRKTPSRARETTAVPDRAHTDR